MSEDGPYWDTLSRMLDGHDDDLGLTALGVKHKATHEDLGEWIGNVCKEEETGNDRADHLSPRADQRPHEQQWRAPPCDLPKPPKLSRIGPAIQEISRASRQKLPKFPVDLTAPWHVNESVPAPPPKKVPAPAPNKVPKSASVPNSQEYKPFTPCGEMPGGKSPTYTPCGEDDVDDMPPPSQHASSLPCDDDDDEDYMHHPAMGPTAFTGFSVAGNARSEASGWLPNLRSSGSAAESWAQPIGSRSVKRSISGKPKAQPIGASAQPVAPRRRTGAGSSVSQNWRRWVMTPPPPETHQSRIPPGQGNPRNQENGARTPRPRGGKHKHWHTGFIRATAWSRRAQTAFIAKFQDKAAYTREDLEWMHEVEYLKELHENGARAPA